MAWRTGAQASPQPLALYNRISDGVASTPLKGGAKRLRNLADHRAQGLDQARYLLGFDDQRG
jgi:hypothetical protein